jgi:hypothetical protein
MTTLSVQSNTCSDRDGEEIRCCSAQSSSSAAADVAIDGTSATRFAHRAVLALRQTRLQVRSRRGAWSQVLLVGELHGPSSADGLRASGRLRARQSKPVELPAASRRHRRDLRDQSRTVAPSRGALRHAGGRIESSARPHHRRRCCCRGCDRHGPELARCPRQSRSIGDGGMQ